MAITRYTLSEELKQRLESNTTLLTPSYRLAASVTEAYGSAVASSSWKVPAIIAVDQWISQSWNLLANRGLAPFVGSEILDTALEKELWLEAIEDTREQHPLIDASAMAQIAARAFQDLQRWGKDSASYTLQGYEHLEDVALYLSWREKFLARCRALGRITLVEASSILATALDAESLTLLGHITLLDFQQPPPNYEALFARFRESQLLDSLQTKPADIDAHSSESPFDAMQEQTLRYEFVCQEDEIAAAARWASALQKKSPGAHIGFLSPNPERIRAPLYQALLAHHSEEPALALASRPYLINSSSGGVALVDTAIAHDALAILDLNRERIALGEFCQLLESPFLGLAESEGEARANCQRALRRYLQAETSKQAIARFTGAEGKDWHSPFLHEALLTCRTLLRGTAKLQTTRAWSTLFREQLSIVGWPNHAIGATSHAALGEWEDALQRFEAAGEYKAEMSVEEALNTLRRTVREYRARGEYRQQCPLSLYSPTEAVGLSFEYLWLIGFDDQSWPAPAHANPLIPIELQRSLGIPGSSASLSFSKALGELKLVCANVSSTLVVSHHSQDDELPKRASSVTASLPLVDSGSLLLPDSTSNLELELQEHPDERRARLQPGASSNGGHSVITRQSQCPFQAFIKTRLGVQALEPIRNSLDARDRGSVVHWALEAFYSTPTTRDALLELLTENPAEFEQRLDSAIESATQKLQQQHPEIMGAIFTNLERARLKSLLQRFLLRDSERASFITGVPEKAYTLQIGALSLNLKIDRVDTLADKSVALIDYKTGKSITALSGLDTERPEDMQLPVYYRTVSQEPATQVSALAIAQVHNEAVDYHALSAQPNFDPQLDPHTGKKLSAKKQKEQKEQKEHKSIDEAKTQWNIKTQHWTDLVERLADEFIRGDCNVSPIASKTVCERCGLQSLCRIKELEGNVDRDDEDYSELGISNDE